MTAEQFGILLAAMAGAVWYLERKLWAIWTELYLLRQLRLLEMGKIDEESWRAARDNVLGLKDHLG